MKVKGKEKEYERKPALKDFIPKAFDTFKAEAGGVMGMTKSYAKDIRLLHNILHSAAWHFYHLYQAAGWRTCPVPDKTGIGRSNSL